MRNKVGTEPLYKQIKTYLMTLIQQNFHNQRYRLPSENQIATQFGTSRIPVIQAMRELEEEGKIYRVQGSGSFIKNDYAEQNHPEMRFGLLIPQAQSHYCTEMINGIRAYLNQHNIKLYVCLTDNDPQQEKAFIESIHSMQFQGLLLFPVLHGTYNNTILNLVISKFPVVFVARNMPHLNVSSVFSDPYNQAFRAVEYLAQLGHSNIGIISEVAQGNYFYENRRRGYESALQQYCHNKATAIIEIDFFGESTDNLQQDIADRVEEFIVGHPEITAFITSNLAVTAIYQHLVKHHVPAGKYTILVYDCAEKMDAFNYQHLVVIDQNPYQIGYAAAEQLYKQVLRNEPLRNIDVPEQFVVKTTGQPE